MADEPDRMKNYLKRFKRISVPWWGREEIHKQVLQDGASVGGIFPKKVCEELLAGTLTRRRLAQLFSRKVLERRILESALNNKNVEYDERNVLRLKEGSLLHEFCEKHGIKPKPSLFGTLKKPISGVKKIINRIRTR